MCGIFGAVSREPLPSDEGRILALATGLLMHRGPDEEGFYRDRFAVLGMRRLSIIDLVTGQQPVTNERGTLQLVFNGEIYNYAELRRRLLELGHVFASQSDSEVLVHLMARPESAGHEDSLPRCLKQLKGAYSFLLLDKNSVTAIRDPLGFRPLCVGRLESGIVFASETCALDLVGAEYVRDVSPGEILSVDALGWHSETMERPDTEARCIFEHVYFARPDSNVFGENVHKVRMSLGRRLAKDLD